MIPSQRDKSNMTIDTIRITNVLRLKIKDFVEKRSICRYLIL